MLQYCQNLPSRYLTRVVNLFLSSASCFFLKKISCQPVLLFLELMLDTLGVYAGLLVFVLIVAVERNLSSGNSFAIVS
jgi:hypothetical protein